MTKTAITSKHSRGEVLYYLLAGLMFYSFAMLFVYDTKGYQQTIENEVRATINSLEEGTAEELLEISRERQQSWIYRSGFYPTIYKFFAPKEVKYIDDWSKGVLGGGIMFKFLTNVQYLGYQIIHRLTVLQLWMMALLPLMMAIVMTGYYKWRITQYRLGGQSAGVVRIWSKVVWLAFITLTTYIIFPAVLGDLAVYAPVTILMLMAIGVGQIVKSFNKYI
jgi:hypothetical protein